MKKIYLLVLCLCLSKTVFAQDKLENNFGANLQVFGAGVNYEYALNNAFSINALATYEGGFFQGLDGDVNYFLTTTFGLEPRWYHNRKRRGDKGKNTSFNVGNFVSGELFYLPDLFSSSTDNNVSVDTGFALGIKYGLRRKIVEKLHFEFAIGIAQVFSDETDSFASPLIDIKFQYVLF